MIAIQSAIGSAHLDAEGLPAAWVVEVGAKAPLVVGAKVWVLLIGHGPEAHCTMATRVSRIWTSTTRGEPCKTLQLAPVVVRVSGLIETYLQCFDGHSSRDPGKASTDFVSATSGILFVRIRVCCGQWRTLVRNSAQ